VALVSSLIACVSCEKDGADAPADDDAMTAEPPVEAGLDGSDDASMVLDGATSGAGGAGAGGAGASGMDGATDAASTDDSGADASDTDASTMAEITHVYVGGYGAEITHFVLDRQSGELDHRGAISAGNAPSYLAVHPLRDALYAVNEQSSSAASQVLAFAIDPVDGELSMINAVPSGGEGAPHLAVHPTGQWVGVAHYDSGHTSILSVRDDRGLGGVIDIDRGPGDTARKAHQAVFDARGTTLLVPCLENDFVLQYQFNLGALVLNSPASAPVAGGPRHMVLSPDQSRAYVLSELDSLLTSFVYDGTFGLLSSPETIDSQEDTKGGSAHIAIHPSGKWLYASNRAENSVGVFAIDADGRPSPVAFERAGIATPRDFGIDPLGEFLIVANYSGAQDLRVYRIDPDDGTLTFLRATNVGGQPSSVVFAQLPQ
jgi:6-phosphogluconolactonase